MHCPRCKYPRFTSNGTCPQCGFDGDSVQVEKLLRLEWLLGEMNTWVDQGILNNVPKRLQNYYLTLQQEVRTRLGLSYSPFTSSEADKAWHELHLHELLFKEIGGWLEAKQLRSGFLPTYYARLIELQNRLAGHKKPQMAATDSSKLEEIDFLLRAIARLDQRDDFITTEARRKIISPLLSEEETLEKNLLPPAEIKAEKPSKNPRQE